MANHNTRRWFKRHILLSVLLAVSYACLHIFIFDGAVEIQLSDDDKLIIDMLVDQAPARPQVGKGDTTDVYAAYRRDSMERENVKRRILLYLVTSYDFIEGHQYPELRERYKEGLKQSSMPVTEKPAAKPSIKPSMPGLAARKESGNRPGGNIGQEKENIPAQDSVALAKEAAKKMVRKFGILKEKFSDMEMGDFKMLINPSPSPLQLAGYLELGEFVFVLKTTHFNVRSFFWLSGHSIFVEIIFWSIFGLFASLFYSISEAVKRGEEVNEHEKPVHWAKFVYAPIVSVVVFLSVGLLSSAQEISIPVAGHNALIVSFILGFYSSRAVDLLNRVKEVVFPASGTDKSALTGSMLVHGTVSFSESVAEPPVKELKSAQVLIKNKNEENIKYEFPLNEKGKFHMGLPPGDYVIKVTLEFSGKKYSGEDNVKVEEGQDEKVTINLAEAAAPAPAPTPPPATGALMNGQLTFAAGAENPPVAELKNTSVQLEEKEGKVEAINATVDDKGAFSLQLPAGKYTATALLQAGENTWLATAETESDGSTEIQLSLELSQQ